LEPWFSESTIRKHLIKKSYKSDPLKIKFWGGCVFFKFAGKLIPELLLNVLLYFYEFAFSQIWECKKNNSVQSQLMHTTRLFNPLWAITNTFRKNKQKFLRFYFGRFSKQSHFFTCSSQCVFELSLYKYFLTSFHYQAIFSNWNF